MSERPLEHCCLCGDETGRAGRADDSIYLECVHAFQATPNPDGPSIMPGEEVGPLCVSCRDRLVSFGYVKDE